MSEQQEELCRATTVPQDFSLEVDVVSAFPELNISSFTYFVCGVGWLNRVLIELVDILTVESLPPPQLQLGGSPRFR